MEAVLVALEATGGSKKSLLIPGRIRFMQIRDISKKKFFKVLLLFWVLCFCGMLSHADEKSSQDHTDDSALTGTTASSQSLKAEYSRLLEEKKELDNNKSFQKRRMKRKYKNRPYIKEMIEQEEQIIKRLEEIELMMKAEKSGKKF